MQKLIEKNAEINNKRFIIIRSDNSKRVIQADNNVKSRAEHFAAYEKLTVISITKL